MLECHSLSFGGWAEGKGEKQRELLGGQCIVQGGVAKVRMGLGAAGAKRSGKFKAHFERSTPGLLSALWQPVGASGHGAQVQS